MAFAQCVSEVTKRWTDAEGRPIAVEEIVFRVIDGMRVLTPTKKNNALISGVMALAQEHYGFEAYSVGMMTNHGHYLIGVRDAAQRAAIMQFIHGNLVKEIGWHGDHGVHSTTRRLKRGKRIVVIAPFKWRAGLLGRRGTPTPIGTDTELVERFKYVTAQSTKAGLAASPMTSVHLNAGQALWSGEMEIGGIWVDRTKLTALRKKNGKDVPESEATRETKLKLSKLPHLRHLSDDAYRDFCRKTCREIVEEAKAEHGEHHRPPSANALRNVDPRSRNDLDATPAPSFHCDDPVLRAQFYEDRRTFREAFQIAHHALKLALREGRPFTGTFPPGCILPGQLLRD